MSLPILWSSTFTSGSIAHQAAMVSGVPIDVRFISMRGGDTRTPEYLAINPKGEVPALQLPDGAVITEMPAILFWLAEAAPGSGLLPPGATARAKAMEWLAWCHWSMGRNFNPAFLPARMAGAEGAGADAVRAAALERVQKDFTLAEATLAKGQGTLLGTASPSAPDIFLTALVAFAGFLKMDMAPYPALLALQARVHAMPGVVAAMEREKA